MRIFLLVWEHCSSTVSCITMISHWRESAPAPPRNPAPASPPPRLDGSPPGARQLRVGGGGGEAELVAAAPHLAPRLAPLRRRLLHALLHTWLQRCYRCAALTFTRV